MSFKRIREFQMLFAALILSIALFATPSIQPALAQGVLITDTITSPSLEGNPLGDPATRNMTIYLPPSYDQGGNFPVVYLLHGYPGDEKIFIDKDHPYWLTEVDFPENGFSGMLDDLIAAGELKEVIVVMSDASNKYGGSWYTNSELTGNYEDYIVEDIVSYIDSHYRTIPSRDSRAIVGHSMGGYGAMKLAMKHPDVFGAVASHGGALYFEVFKGMIPMMIEENPDGMMGPDPGKFLTSGTYAMSAAFSPNLENPPFFVDLPLEYPTGNIVDEVWDKFMQHDALTMLGTYGANLASLKGVYLDCGNQDEFGTDFQTEAFHQALTAAGIEHEYEMYAGAHYDRMFERLAISLSFLSDALVAGEAYENVFFTSLLPGLNMISLPLEPIVPYTARSFAEMLSATAVIKLDEARQRFVGFTLDAPDDGFAIEGGKGYIVNVPEAKVVAFTGAAWTNQPPVEAAPQSVVGANPLWSPDGAWAFVVSGTLQDDSDDTLKKNGYIVTVRNTRTNTVATDVVRSRYFAAAFADLNRNNVVETGDRLELQVRNQAGEIVSNTLTYTVTAKTIRQAFMPLTLKNIEIPRQSMLLPNYPNPFNPETWIPYQIRESAEVVIRIYNVQGQLVRKLDLRQRAAGFYLGRTRAAYWDGLNFAGEKVASGIYFYHLQSGDFSATRRMLVLK